MGSKRISRRSWTDEQLIEAVKTSKTIAEVSRKLGLTNYGANSRTIKKRMDYLQLDSSHFFTVSEQLKIARRQVKLLNADQIFDINTVGNKLIKQYIIKHQLMPYECVNCKINAWMEKPLSLHLDHINGINNDNRLSNLRFLCPNCHSQTNTYCGRKLKGKRRVVNNRCIDCNISIHRKSKRCKSCAQKRGPTKINWIDTPTLKSMVEELGYSETGRRLGVSNNAVKKRIRNHPT